MIAPWGRASGTISPRRIEGRVAEVRNSRRERGEGRSKSFYREQPAGRSHLKADCSAGKRRRGYEDALKVRLSDKPRDWGLGQCEHPGRPVCKCGVVTAGWRLGEV